MSATKARRAAPLTLVVNQVGHGETLVYLDKDDVLVPRASLEAARLKSANGRLTEIAGKKYVSLRSLTPSVRYVVDQEALSLRLTSDPRLLGATTMDLHRSARPSHLIHRQDTSAFLNYGLRAVGLSGYDGFAEAGLSVRGVLFANTVAFSASQRPTRGLSKLTIDDRGGLRRLTLGDSFASSGGLGGGLFVGGIQLARNFSLDPYFRTAPSIGRSGTALVPSTVEVYVNGTLVRRQDVAPGTFNVDNLPATAGSGNTRIIVRDALGRETEISSTYYMPSGLLARGLSEYSYTLGFARHNVGVESWDYGGVALVGRHRLGLTKSLTAGLRGEASLSLASAGLAATIGLPVGQIEAAGSASLDSGRTGAAGSMAYAYRGRELSLATYSRLVSDRHATLDVGAAAERRVFEAGGSAGVPFGRKMSVTGQAAATLDQERRWGHRFSLVANRRLARKLQLSMSVGQSWRRAEPRHFEWYTTLSWVLTKKTMGSLNYRQRGNSGTSSVGVHRSLPEGSGVGYRLSANLGEQERGYGRVDAQGAHGRYHASYDWTAGNGAASAGASGGVVLIGGRVFATRPVQQGYALIRVPHVEGVRGLLNNQDVGRTNSNGDLLVPTLQPYYGNRLGITPVDVPLDHSVPYTERIVAPPYRGGAIIEFPVRRMQMVRGSIVLHGAKGRVSAAFGRLTVKLGEREVSSPIGPDGEFELENMPSGRRAALVQYDGGDCVFKLRVPNFTSAVVNVGRIKCPVDRRNER